MQHRRTPTPSRHQPFEAYNQDMKLKSYFTKNRDFVINVDKDQTVVTVQDETQTSDIRMAIGGEKAM
jgi:hypothetical protein